MPIINRHMESCMYFYDQQNNTVPVDQGTVSRGCCVLHNKYSLVFIRVGGLSHTQCQGAHHKPTLQLYTDVRRVSTCISSLISILVMIFSIVNGAFSLSAI